MQLLGPSLGVHRLMGGNPYTASQRPENLVGLSWDIRSAVSELQREFPKQNIEALTPRTISPEANSRMVEAKSEVNQSKAK